MINEMDEEEITRFIEKHMPIKKRKRINMVKFLPALY